MLHKLYKKQVEAWKELNEEMLWVAPEEVESVLLSRHKYTIELIEAEIERKRKILKELPAKLLGRNKKTGYSLAIDEDIAYLESQLELIKKEL